jgi:hypothetical protein
MRRSKIALDKKLGAAYNDFKGTWVESNKEKERP